MIENDINSGFYVKMKSWDAIAHQNLQNLKKNFWAPLWKKTAY